MSAFFVGEDHINALLTYCETCNAFGVPVPLRGRVNRPSDSDLSEVGRELIRENIKSLSDRYPDDYAECLPLDYDVANFRYVPDYGFLIKPDKVARLAKLIHCYEYQACEHDAWGDSWSAEFCQWMINRLIGEMPGYESAPWGYEKPADNDSSFVIALSRLAEESRS